MTKKSVALFDIDKTIYRDDAVFPLITELIEKGLINPMVDERLVMIYGEYKLGILSYSKTATKVLEIWAEALTGLEYEKITNITAGFFDKNRDRFFSYFKKLLPTLKETHNIYLVTADPQFVAETIKEMFGLDGYFSTKFEVVEDKFTGKIISSLANGKDVADKMVKKYSGKTMAFGDSENDTGMLEEVEIPVCVNPTDELLERATKDGWLVVSDTEAYEKVTELLNK